MGVGGVNNFLTSTPIGNFSCKPPVKYFLGIGWDMVTQ